MAMFVLMMTALPGTDADATDLAALTTSRYKEKELEDVFAYAPWDATRLAGQDQTKAMPNLWSEPRPRQVRILNTYTPLTDSNIKTAAQVWVSNQASASLTYGPVHMWDLSQVTSSANIWCGYDAANCGSAYVAMQSFNSDISTWDVSKVTSMYYSKSIRIFDNDSS